MTRMKMQARRRSLRLLAPAALAALALGLSACGGDDSSGDTTAAAQEPKGPELAAVKTYLTDHSAALKGAVADMNAASDEYYALAESYDFDYAKMMKNDRAEVERILGEAKKAFAVANPSYEEMEGIVAGVPRLAHYDVDIDAGSDAKSDPSSAVSFTIDVPGEKPLVQPGNLFFLTETSLYGTNPDLQAEGVEPDINGDGKVEIGEGLPDAKKFKASLKEFQDQADSLDKDAAAFEPTPSDAFTAITVMTPTMGEYFDAWKNSVFIQGKGATEQSFVASSRLNDIRDILTGIDLTYSSVKPLIAEENPQQADQTGQQLTELIDFVTDLRDREEQGQKFKPEQADTFGSEAQSQAEDIAGQVTQAAERLNIQLQES